MASKKTTDKVRYLLKERGRYYYQRKVPKALVHHLGTTRWHIPVGSDFDSAQVKIAELRKEHDALISKAKYDPEELTRLRRQREENERKANTVSADADNAYRDKVLSGEIDDADELEIILLEKELGRVEPPWTGTLEVISGLESLRKPSINISIRSAPSAAPFSDEDFDRVIEPVIKRVSAEQARLWRAMVVGRPGVRVAFVPSASIDDDEYHDKLKVHHERNFGAATSPPRDEDARLEWDMLKLRIERLIARHAPVSDRLSTVFERFLAFNDIKTEGKYRRVFKQFTTFATDLPVTQVTPKLLREYRDHLIAKGNNIATVKAAFSPLKSLYRFALDEEIVEVNPTASVTFPKDTRPVEETRHLPFTQDEMARILTAVDELWGKSFPHLSNERRIAIRHIVRALAFTAARPIELLSLEPSDVNDYAINIRRTKTRASWRYIPVHPEISDFPKFIQDGGLACFRTIETDTVEPVRHNFMRLLRKLIEPPISEPRKTLYSFRGSFQDALRRAGAPLEVRQAILGHREGGAIKHYDSGPEFELMRDWVHKSDPRL